VGMRVESSAARCRAVDSAPLPAWDGVARGPLRGLLGTGKLRARVTSASVRLAAPSCPAG
jgi:hypothetical protein